VPGVNDGIVCVKFAVVGPDIEYILSVISGKGLVLQQIPLEVIVPVATILLPPDTADVLATLVIGFVVI
jgi:hypothetical protein